VIGTSEDGSIVYFVADGRLASGAPAGDCKSGEDRGSVKCDLYAENTVTGARTLVAVLSGGDSPDWGGENGGLVADLTARLSSDGRYLAFMSERSLTGYDNVDARSGVNDEEVFLYDYDTGSLVCASCNPSGARPTGMLDPSEGAAPLIDRPHVWAGHWLAASVPSWTKSIDTIALYQSRYLSSEGRLFFDSADSLVPQDVNGKEDVYEYEPSGVGSCEDGTSCLSLISAGASNEESVFLDASVSGDDVFFLTASGLVPQDQDGALDVYDAHVCTAVLPCAANPPTAPPPCVTAESCRAAPTLQPTIFGAPASATVSGAGDVPATPTVSSKKAKPLTRAQRLSKALKACRVKRSGRRRAVCEAEAHKKYGPVKSKRDSRRGESRKTSTPKAGK
jgi:hypothetical protein